jgi:Cu/Ag efflux protein CusF
MKTLPIRPRPIVAFLALTLALALPVQAARLIRTRAYQTETFQVATNAHIAVGDNRKASLEDLKVGDHVSIGYVEENDAKLARRISDGVPHKPPTPGATPSQKPNHHPAASALLHAHGVIQSVDLDASTVTISHRAR